MSIQKVGLSDARLYEPQDVRVTFEDWRLLRAVCIQMLGMSLLVTRETVSIDRDPMAFAMSRWGYQTAAYTFNALNHRPGPVPDDRRQVLLRLDPLQIKTLEAGCLTLSGPNQSYRNPIINIANLKEADMPRLLRLASKFSSLPVRLLPDPAFLDDYCMQLPDPAVQRTQLLEFADAEDRPLPLLTPWPPVRREMN